MDQGSRGRTAARGPVTEKTFVGFGFGPIQSALFLLEAYRSGNFDRFVVAEVDNAIVQAVRDHGGRYTVNVAHPDRIEAVPIDGVELYNPSVTEDRNKLVEAIATSSEITTALPSVKFYATGGPAAVVALLAEGLAART